MLMVTYIHTLHTHTHTHTHMHTHTHTCTHTHMHTHMLSPHSILDQFDPHFINPYEPVRDNGSQLSVKFSNPMFTSTQSVIPEEESLDDSTEQDHRFKTTTTSTTITTDLFVLQEYDEELTNPYPSSDTDADTRKFECDEDDEEDLETSSGYTSVDMDRTHSNSRIRSTEVDVSQYNNGSLASSGYSSSIGTGYAMVSTSGSNIPAMVDSCGGPTITVTCIEEDDGDNDEFEGKLSSQMQVEERAIEEEVESITTTDCSDTEDADDICGSTRDASKEFQTCKAVSHPCTLDDIEAASESQEEDTSSEEYDLGMFDDECDSNMFRSRERSLRTGYVY